MSHGPLTTDGRRAKFSDVWAELQERGLVERYQPAMRTLCELVYRRGYAEGRAEAVSQAVDPVLDALRKKAR